jgi:hypothetical protein
MCLFVSPGGLRDGVAQEGQPRSLPAHGRRSGWPFDTTAGKVKTPEWAPISAVQGVPGSAKLCYCVTVFTASPTLKPVPDTATATAEMSSTSVIFTTPTAEAKRRMTVPVAGSLISRVTRSTLS